MQQPQSGTPVVRSVNELGHLDAPPSYQETFSTRVPPPPSATHPSSRGAQSQPQSPAPTGYVFTGTNSTGSTRGGPQMPSPSVSSRNANPYSTSPGSNYSPAAQPYTPTTITNAQPMQQRGMPNAQSTYQPNSNASSNPFNGARRCGHGQHTYAVKYGVSNIHPICLFI